METQQPQLSSDWSSRPDRQKLDPFRRKQQPRPKELNESKKYVNNENWHLNTRRDNSNLFSKKRACTGHSALPSCEHKTHTNENKTLFYLRHTADKNWQFRRPQRGVKETPSSKSARWDPDWPFTLRRRTRSRGLCKLQLSRHYLSHNVRSVPYVKYNEHVPLTPQISTKNEVGCFRAVPKLQRKNIPWHELVKTITTVNVEIPKEQIQ